MLKYIGESQRPIRNRIAYHRCYIINKHLGKPTGAHFNIPWHSLANMKFTILEPVNGNCDIYRKEREKYLIIIFDTQFNEVNIPKMSPPLGF